MLLASYVSSKRKSTNARRNISRKRQTYIRRRKKGLAPEYPCILPTQCMNGYQCSQRMKEKTLQKFVKDEGMERFVLLLDNLSTHTEENFKKSVCDLGGLVWFGLKSLISKEQQLWLDEEENADRWFGNDKPFSAKERRILISHWADEAWVNCPVKNMILSRRNLANNRLHDDS